jgi:hypothetical protein
LKNKSNIEAQLNQEVANFFGVTPLIIEVITYDDKYSLGRGWIDRSDGKYTEAPSWLVAFATYSGQIHILSPNIIPASYEKTGQLRFKKTLKHEIGHLYTHQINKNIPSWLNEGVSLHIAEQNHYKKINTNNITLSLLDELENTKIDSRIYQIGKNMVDEIVNIGGKELLFEIINTQNKTDRNIILQNTFNWL